MRSAHRNRSAFTLVELLVVIAILTLLVSILLPSLNRARDLARGAVCATSLDQIHTASLLYAESEDGAGPNAMKSLMKDARDSGALDQNGWVQTWWPKVLSDGAYLLDREPDGASQKQLACPVYARAGKGPYVDWDGSLNAAWPRYLDDSHSMVWTDARPGGHDFTYVAYALWRVPRPSEFMFAADHHVLTDYVQPGLHVSPQWVSGLGWQAGMNEYRYAPPSGPGPHAGRTQFVAFDGHVEAQTYEEIRGLRYDATWP